MTSSCQRFGVASRPSPTFINATSAGTASPPAAPVHSGSCKGSTRVPQPPNCFFLFRSSRTREIIEYGRATGRACRQSNLSAMLGREWKELPEAKRRMWQEKARIEKYLHTQKYPHYVFRPERKSTKTEKKKVKKPSNTNYYSLRPTYEYNNSPQLDHMLPFGENSILHFHPSTLFCPPANHSQFPSCSTAPEFMNLDQRTGTYLENVFPCD